MPQIHIPFRKIDEHLDFILENRLDLEIYINSGSLDTLTDSGINELKKRLGYGPSITIHGPFMDLSPGAVDSKVREATLDRFFHTIELTRPLSPKAIVFHSGYEKWKYGLKPEIWLEKSLLTWRTIHQELSGAKTAPKIAIENIFEDEPSTLAKLMEGLRAEGLHGYGVCFDTGHFNLFSKAPLSDWLSALRPYIIELHLHDNDRLSDAHRPIGDGTFDFRELFASLNDDVERIHTIEAHSPEDALTSILRLEELSHRYRA